LLSCFPFNIFYCIISVTDMFRKDNQKPLRFMKRGGKNIKMRIASLLILPERIDNLSKNISSKCVEILL